MEEGEVGFVGSGDWNMGFVSGSCACSRDDLLCGFLGWD